MAMTREEERELRLSCSIGSLLSSLEKRPELKEERPSPPREEKPSGGTKRNAEDGEEEEEEGGEPEAKKSKEEEEGKLLEYFMEDVPDYEENDPDYVIEEKKYLIEEYGKRIITLGFDERDRFVYTCEICNAQFHQRKMLEAHCIGTKHVKKKFLLDRKMKGKDVPNISMVIGKKANKPSWTTKSYDKDENESWKRNKYPKKYYSEAGGNRYPPHHYDPLSFPPPGPPPNFYGQWDPNSSNLYNTPPPSLDGNGNKSSLSGGTTGSLLQQLADSAVKNDKDSDLAINVVMALMKSLKDFNHKRGETRFIEVLTEADVTFRVLKTLKPVNKGQDTGSPDQDDSQDQNSSSTAFGTSEFAQGILDDQYYTSQNNPSSNSSGVGPPYSNNFPTGVPPPTVNLNTKGANGYPQDASNAEYNQNSQGNDYGYGVQNFSGYGYGNQNPTSQGYGTQGPGVSGYYHQGQSTSYSQSAGVQNMQTTNNYNSGQASEKNSAKIDSTTNVTASLPPPPPPPPLPPSDNSAPDLSNYGYAAGYSMGYYNVPPPGHNQSY